MFVLGSTVGKPEPLAFWRRSRGQLAPTPRRSRDVKTRPGAGTGRDDLGARPDHGRCAVGRADRFGRLR